MTLRFGIEHMQASLLMQHVSSPQNRRTPSTGGPPDQYELDIDVASLAVQLADLGFNLMELNPDLTVFFPHCYDLPALKRLGDLKNKRHLEYTVHLPLWSLEPATPMQAVREGSVDTLVDAVLRVAPLEPEVYVVHATGALAAEFARMRALENVRPLVLGLLVAQARRSMQQLLERTGLQPRRVAIETIEFPFDLTLALAEEFDLSMCLDAGHVVAGYTTGVTLEDALQRALPRLAEVHLHDAYRRVGPDGSLRVADHLALGNGDVPLGPFLDGLESAGFAGPIILELTIEEAQASLEVIRALRPELVMPRREIGAA
jgi:sugar phosphate isomerase/epimerase